jgi:hypothetical protein
MVPMPSNQPESKMNASNRLEVGVTDKLNQWDRESQIHFCLLADKSDVTFENVSYPTGLKKVIARAAGQKAEVMLPVAKMLRANGYVICC